MRFDVVLWLVVGHQQCQDDAKVGRNDDHVDDELGALMKDDMIVVHVLQEICHVW